MERKTTVKRETKETRVWLELNLDGRGNYEIDTSVPFLDHMLELATRHGFFDLRIKATGDLSVGIHHTVEDIGITLGQALKETLGDKKGLLRYGEATIPMDEALAQVVIDLVSRAVLVYKVELPKAKVGEFDVETVEEFFRALTNHSGITLHIRAIYGENLHHVIEAIFKAFGQALHCATRRSEMIEGVLSTKGEL